MRFTVAAFFPVLLAACARTQDPAALGRGAFVAFGCSNCHAVGAGGPNTGVNLAYAGFMHTPEWLDLWLQDPRRWKKATAMPDPRLSKEGRKRIVAYLSTLKGQGYDKEGRPWESPALRADPVERGRALFNGAGCAGCHGPRGKGGFPNNNVYGDRVPELDHVKGEFSEQELRRKIQFGVSDPHPENPRLPDPMLSMPAWGQVLKDDDIDALIAYLYSISRPPKEGW